MEQMLTNFNKDEQIQ